MSEHTKGELSVSAWIEAPNNKAKPSIVSDGVTVAITHPAPICKWGECEANAKRIALTWNCHDELVEALVSMNKLVCHAQEILQIYLVPGDTRIQSDNEAVSELLGLLDGIEQRETQSNAKEAIRL